MKNNKQTAVEWLVEQLGKNGFISTYESIKRDELQSIIEQAKEIHKQQIIKAHKEFVDTQLPNEVYEQYYNEEYGK